MNAATNQVHAISQAPPEISISLGTPSFTVTPDSSGSRTSKLLVSSEFHIDRTRIIDGRQILDLVPLYESSLSNSSGKPLEPTKNWGRVIPLRQATGKWAARLEIGVD